MQDALALLLALAVPVGDATSAGADAKPRELVVLEAALENTAYATAAGALARLHGGTVLVWSGAFDVLDHELRTRAPRDVAFVLAPCTIDANLVRVLVPLLARLDDDPFVDCNFGFVTGATGEDAQRLVATIAAALERPRAATKVEATSVQLDRCVRVAARNEHGSDGRSLNTTSLWVTGQDADWRTFVAANRVAQNGVGLVEWGHCGDSQGIWLFSMYRNREHDKHWPYDPAKIGADPKGELPRLTPALLLDGVDLGGAIVINGSCHSAVTCRTIVGPDIVSTFGDTGGLVRFHDLAPAESFTLQAIAHGAAAYIAPLAANNANRAALEEWTIRSGGVSLGEVMRRGYDELVMGATTLPLSFATFEDGQPEPREGPMFADCVHRVLFGDPALVAYTDRSVTSHRVVMTELDGVLAIDITYADAAHDPWIWDPWLETKARTERGRMYEVVALSGRPNGTPLVEVVAASALHGTTSKPLALEARAAVEIDPDGRPFLHLKACGARAEMSPSDPKDRPDVLHARFEVRFARPK